MGQYLIRIYLRDDENNSPDSSHTANMCDLLLFSALGGINGLYQDCASALFVPF
jgi:hypothetical protein